MDATNAAPSPPGEEPEVTLEQSVRVGLLGAALLTVSTAAALCVWMLFVLLDRGVVDPLLGGWGQMAAGLSLAFVSYFVAGALGGVVFWLLRGRRPSLAGWVLTMSLIGATINATCGVFGAIGYFAFGVRLLVFSSFAEFGGMLLELTGIWMVLGALSGPFFWWLDEQLWRRTHAHRGTEASV